MKHVRLNRSPEAKARAREFRKNMSVSEKWFWAAVRKDALGYRVRRQHRIGPYILDFYIPQAKLCVEIDGEQHAERSAADARRDCYLGEYGILTLRIPSLDLFFREQNRYSAWIHEVLRLCGERAGSPPPTPSSREREEGHVTLHPLPPPLAGREEQKETLHPLPPPLAGREEGECAPLVQQEANDGPAS